MLDDATLDAHLRRLRNPPPPVELVRACTVGDGIIDGEPAPAQGVSPLRVVPASGAATRMFQALDRVTQPSLSELERISAEAPSLRPALRALSGWSDLALSRALPDVDPSADLPASLKTLRESGWSSRPKGLVPFHVHGADWRSAIEGHLREAVATGSTAVHLTAPTDHLDAFEAEVQAAVERVQADTGVALDVSLSVQHPDTDTPAIDPDGALIRDQDGTPWLRPGGHGALLRNLDALWGLIRIINVDNVAHEDHRAQLRPWGHTLVKACLDLRDQRDTLVRQVRQGQGVAEARAFLAQLGYTGPDDADAVLADLFRPVRICAVVPNDGQPGGGPFWVRGADGRVTAQIVEGAEVNTADAAQQAIWASSTHFNPVDIVCWLDDPDGANHDLFAYVDDRRWIHTHKRHGGVQAHCLERPGLWNGSMSGWLTRFIAVPRETFNPVKTLADLLDPRHRPAG